MDLSPSLCGKQACVWFDGGFRASSLSPLVQATHLKLYWLASEERV